MKEVLAYIEDLRKVAFEQLMDVEERKGYPVKKHLQAALIIGAGSAIGAGLGTGAAYLVNKYVPDGVKQYAIPAIVGGGMLLGGVAASALDNAKEEHIRGPEIERVLLRAPDEESYQKIRSVFSEGAPIGSGKRIYMAQGDKPIHGMDREIHVGPDASREQLKRLIWSK